MNGPTCLRALGLKCNAPPDCRNFHCPRLTADVKEKTP